jgi:hypothetical protein
MNLGEYKRKLIDTGLFRKVSGKGQYVCKSCPYCGDTKNHFYVLICQEDDSPVLFNCFKCNAKGILNEKFMEYFGIDDIEIPKYKGHRRIRPSDSQSVVMKLIDKEHDVDMINNAYAYIHHRVGVVPSFDDLIKFQIIGNPIQYIQNYLGGDLKGTKDRLWFRLNNGTIIGRKMDSDDGFRWKKRTPVNDVTDAGIYIIKKEIDPSQTINVCVCEGVMDAIGLYYHGNINNGVFIACMGRDYMIGIRHVISTGIFGDSVIVRIFKDNDVEFVRINKVYSKLFKKIEIYHNMISKDFGVPESQIEIEKCM